VLPRQQTVTRLEKKSVLNAFLIHIYRGDVLQQVAVEFVSCEFETHQMLPLFSLNRKLYHHCLVPWLVQEMDSIVIAQLK